MADTAEEIKPVDVNCKACGDSAHVRLSLKGANGELVREVPCPECSEGIALAVNRDAALSDLRDRIQKLVLTVIVAITLAAVAGFLAGSGWPDAKRVITVVKDEVTE